MNNIKLIETYYKKQYDYFNKILKYSDYEFIFSYINDKHIVDIYINKNNNKKKILKAEYEVLGCYNIISSIWTWSWALSMIEKNLSSNSKKILDYGIKLKNNKKTNSEIQKNIYYLTNPSFYISDKNLLELYKLSIYITKNLWFITRKINNIEKGIIEILLIKKILQEK
jgi:hypothetical protein